VVIFARYMLQEIQRGLVRVEVDWRMVVGVIDGDDDAFGWSSR
jgi:hypothetical protein